MLNIKLNARVRVEERVSGRWTSLRVRPRRMADSVSRRRLLPTITHYVGDIIKWGPIGHAIYDSGQFDGGSQSSTDGICKTQAATIIEPFGRVEMHTFIRHDRRTVCGIICKNRAIILSNPKDPVAGLDGIACELHLVEGVMKNKSAGQIAAPTANREIHQRWRHWRRRRWRW